MNLTATDTIRWLHKTHNKIVEQIDYLTELDGKIGDGDHGINMARGFKAVVHTIDQLNVNEHSSADIMKKSAMTLMTAVDGASGILYGTAFLRMAAVFQHQQCVTQAIFTKALQEAVNGIKQRGNVDYGAKTLLDVWVDLATLFEQSVHFPKANIIEKTARRSTANTKKYKATRGKAALYEDESIGHIDPGAASTYCLFAALAEVCEENENE